MNAKKKTAKKKNETQVKVFFNTEEHKTLKIAVALQEITMREFIKNVVMKEANKLVPKSLR